MTEMVEYLQKIGFSKLEAQIYLNLLQSSGLTGYQIAKELNISRSSVYPALESMYKKGYVMLVQGESQSYVAEDPNALLSKLKDDFYSNTNFLDTQLKNIKVGNVEERFLNISGFDQMINKTKELLRLAREEVIMNINGGISYLRDEIISLRKRGVRVIIFSFAKLDVSGLDVEYFSHETFDNSDLSRIMLVVDFKQTLVADIYDQRPIWLGVLTNNPLMTSIVCEHIHHDIYLLVIDSKLRYEILTNNKLNSIMEKGRTFLSCEPICKSYKWS